MRILRNGVSPSSQRIESGKASSRQSLPHLCWRGSLSRTKVQVAGAEGGWLTALVMELLGIRTCLQPCPSGPGPNHEVTCTDSLFQRERVPCLPWYPTAQSLHWGLWPAFPLEARPPLSPVTGQEPGALRVLYCAHQRCPPSPASLTCRPPAAPGGSSHMQHLGVLGPLVGWPRQAKFGDLPCLLE